jgi:VWFA-related protein
MQQVSPCCAALFLTVLAQFCFASPALCAQELQPPDRVNPPKGGQARPTFLTQTKLVTVTFTFRPSAKQTRLMARNGLDLTPDDIEILDNGVPQTLAVLQRTGMPEATLPTDVILLVDCSRRFRPHIDSHGVNFHFLDELENVRLSIYGFGDSLHRLVRPSRDTALLAAAMKDLFRIPNYGATDVNPIIQTMEDAVAIPGSRPRMLIIYSGAVSRACQMPRNDYAEAVRLAREYDIALFPVAVQPQTPSIQPASVSGPDAIRNPVPPARSFAPVGEFLKIGPATGGKAFTRFATPKNVLDDVFKYVRSRARSEYLAGFYLGALSESGKMPHRIEVRLKRNVGEITGGVRETNY